MTADSQRLVADNGGPPMHDQRRLMRDADALPEVPLSPSPHCPHLKATLCAYGAGGAEFWSAWRLVGRGSRSEGDGDTVDDGDGCVTTLVYLL